MRRRQTTRARRSIGAIRRRSKFSCLEEKTMNPRRDRSAAFSNSARLSRRATLAGAVVMLTLAGAVGSNNVGRASGHADEGTAGAESKIAFTADRPGRDAPDEIYVMNGNGTGERRVTVSESGN